VGCAHRSPLPTALPEQKPDIGIVGLVVGPDPSTLTFQRLGVIGAARGAEVGARIGWEAPLRPGLFTLQASLGSFDAKGFVLGLYLTGAGLALAPFGALVGTAAGALAAPSKAGVEQSMAALPRAFADIHLPDALATWIIEAGGERQIIFVAD